VVLRNGLAVALVGGFLGLVWSPGAAFANERRFTFNYETGVLPPGVRELEVWSTARLGREERFTRFDERLEFEVGLTDRLMTSLYLNLTSETAAVPAETGGRELESELEFEGISSEWKYKLTDPVADALGTGLYGEVRFAPTEAELEAKILLDKRVGDLLLVANLVGAVEWQFLLGETRKEYEAEITAGGAYFISPRVSVGLEARVPTIFEVGEAETETLSALYAGPVISYAQDTWWATLTVMPQLAGLATEGSGHSLELDENEKINVRLIFSFHL
jgi:hypothetical protein